VSVRPAIVSPPVCSFSPFFFIIRFSFASLLPVFVRPLKRVCCCVANDVLVASDFCVLRPAEPLTKQQQQQQQQQQQNATTIQRLPPPAFPKRCDVIIRP